MASTFSLLQWISAPIALGLAAAAIGGCPQADRDFGSTGASVSSGQGGAGQGGGGGGQGGAAQGGGGQGGSSQGGGGGQGGSGNEDCLDGIDNDGDDFADCADADCNTGFACVDEAPPGSNGYYLVKELDFPAPKPPPCAGGGPPDIFFTGPAKQAECSACTCGALTGALCGPVPFICYANSSNCSGAPTDYTAALAAGNCVDPNFAFNFQISCMATLPAPVAKPGTCAPSAVDFPNKEPWNGVVEACHAPAGGGCGQGKVCLPKPLVGETQSACYRAADGAGCPMGYSQIDSFTDGADSRGCTACTCGAPGTKCLGASFTVYDLDGCAPGGTDQPLPIDTGGCKNVTVYGDSMTWSIEQTKPPMPNGSCAPSGGAPTGELKPAGPATFCCK